MSYIFLWFVYYGTGMTSGSAHYRSKEACLTAAKNYKERIKEANPEARVGLLCSPEYE